ncbi:MAG: TonB-dependent receptor [Opitutaceae bacterium]|nr:TonB-dependent receptor [Opitutaceae bacterium]
MHFSLRPSLFLTLAIPFAHAQTTPPPATTDDAPVMLETIVVTASPLARSQAELTSATNVLTSRDLALQQQPTLGETLSAQPGISSTYFGPGASRPLIRALGGDRIRILQNGTGTQDASVTSPDHAVSVEPFLVKRIEVVRGPASLLYGGSAVGGVVNVIDHRIETDMPTQRFSGSIDTRYGTVAEEFAYGAVTDIAFAQTDTHAFVLHLDGFKRESDDVHTPAGRLANSAIDSAGASIGVSYVSDTFDAGLNYNGFNSLYGTVAEPDVEIDLRQRRVDFAAEVKQEFGIFSGARLKFGTADYRHVELEAGAPGTTFTNTGYEGRLELLHAPLAGFTGAWGVQTQRSDFDIVGAEAFMPPALTENHALFVFEETKTGPLTWQAGARVENQSIDTRANANFPVAQSRDETTLSLSGGVIYAINPAYALAFSVTGTERAPNAQELYSNGPHIGTASYEVGDPTLATEKSLGAELSLRKLTGFVTGSFNLFANRFDGFIFEQDTGAIDLGDPFDPDDDLPIYQFVQRDALFYGAELETLWHLHASDRHTLDLKLNLDCTVAEESNGDPLPRIPPIKGLIGLAWTGGPWNAGTDWQLVAQQNRSAPSETDTSGYTLLSAYAGYRFVQGPIIYDLFLRGSNLTNEDARLHTSFLKNIAPLPGRSVTFGLRATF